MIHNMDKNSLQVTSSQEKTEYSEEKILLNAYQSAEALKDEIGKIIINRSKLNWDFVNLNSRGPFIYLIFKQKSIEFNN
ncbi:MAG: hypothetical protein ACE5HI_08655 [bacterium]